MSAVEAMRYLLSYAERYGVRGTITSGTRSGADQARLYAARSSSPYPVAAPGTSKHERGRAVDVSAAPEFLAWLGAVWQSWGGTWGGSFRRADPVHFELPG